MKRVFVLVSLAALVMVFASFGARHVMGINTAPFNDSLEKDRTKFITLINESIKGKEKMTVDSVFSNLKVLSGFPAENLVFAITAWSRGLGISCGHCHNTDNFGADENPEKEIAREMVKMGNMINEKLITIKGLSEKPVLNCITCHRGELKPAFRLPVKY